MDMLIKLYELPPFEKAASAIRARGIVVRRAMAYERSWTIAWVDAQFNALWADECAVAFGRQPIGCFIAVNAGDIVGFCCINSTYRNFIGPIGTADKSRGVGIGRALALAALWQMSADGYAYAVVGDVGQPEFFKKTADAVEIGASTPGPYPPKGKLHSKVNTK